LVHAPADQGGIDSVTNQAHFEGVLNSTSNFTDHGVIVLQHDIYVEAVNLAIGYTLPYVLGHNPPFDVKPVMQCQGRPSADMYVETTTNPDNPALDQDVDVATRSSNIGYTGAANDVTVAPSRTYVSPSGYQTSTTTRSGGALQATVAVGITSSILAGLTVILDIL
jgi:hypothetical protein